MAKITDVREHRLRWQILSLASANEIAGIHLEILWMYAQGKLPKTEVDYEALFANYGKELHMVSVLEREPLTSDVDKKALVARIDFAMKNVATHDLLYGGIDHPLMDEMAAGLKEACEKLIGYFENCREEIGDSLKVPDNFTMHGEDHPIEELIDKRDRIGWIILGIWLLQREGCYVGLDVANYERRLKIADMSLRLKFVECVTYHYKDYRDPLPYSPPDFWWRKLRGHEFELTDLAYNKS